MNYAVGEDDGMVSFGLYHGQIFYSLSSIHADQTLKSLEKGRQVTWMFIEPWSQQEICEMGLLTIYIAAATGSIDALSYVSEACKEDRKSVV